MKAKWASKTLWAAVGTFVIAIVAHFTADPEIAKNVEAGIALLLPVLMFALRLITKTGLE